MKNPVRVVITGAAGNIGYAMAFRIASGSMLGPDQPVILQLLEITPALQALQGVVMELNDCAAPLLAGVVATDDLKTAFTDANYAMLVGARPRGPGMERKDLLTANGAIFGPQGKALNDHAARDVKVLVVGNPANTNALSQLAEKTGAHVNDIKKMTIWGNHSATQYPDIGQCTVKGQAAAIIKARGASSAASAASSAIDHMRDWALGTPDGDWVSMAVPADGSYGISEGVIYSYPCVCKNGDYEIVQGLPVDEFSRGKMDATDKELREERASIEDLLK